MQVSGSYEMWLCEAIGTKEKKLSFLVLILAWIKKGCYIPLLWHFRNMIINISKTSNFRVLGMLFYLSQVIYHANLTYIGLSLICYIITAMWHISNCQQHDCFTTDRSYRAPYWCMFVKRINQQILTHWGRVMHICISKLTITGSDNGLSPRRCQAIIWTNAGIFLIGPFGRNFSEISIEIDIFSFKKMLLKMSSAKWWPFCLGLNVLISFTRGQ